MAYGESIGHVIDDVTYVALIGQVRDPNIFGPIISKMAGDTDSVTIGHLQEMAPGVSNGHLTGDVT